MNASFYSPSDAIGVQDIMRHPFAAAQESATGRYCCKSLFAQVTNNSPGRRRDFRVRMWGTSSPDGKLAGDLGNVFEATRNGDRRSDRLLAGKLSSSNIGLCNKICQDRTHAVQHFRDGEERRWYSEPKHNRRGCRARLQNLRITRTMIARCGKEYKPQQRK